MTSTSPTWWSARITPSRRAWCSAFPPPSIAAKAACSRRPWRPGSASTTKGWAIAPYLGYQINKEFALDASIGFGSAKTPVPATWNPKAIACSMPPT
jgi:hypothetical protein